MLFRLPIFFMLVFAHVANVSHALSFAITPAKRALVIGNSNYGEAWEKLENPVNDARDMKTALESIHFEVMLRENLNKRALKDTINEFAGTLQEDDIVVVYYSGHGAKDNQNKNYLIPLRAQINTLAHLEDEAVSLQYL